MPWVATNIGLQIPLKNSYSSRTESMLLPGSDSIAGRALAAIQTSQAAVTAGCGSLPARPVASCLPTEVPLLCAKELFASVLAIRDLLLGLHHFWRVPWHQEGH